MAPVTFFQEYVAEPFALEVTEKLTFAGLVNDTPNDQTVFVCLPEKNIEKPVKE